MGKSIGFGPAPADFEDVVFSFHIPQISHSLAECFNVRRRHVSGRGNEEADPVDFPWLLGRGRRAKRKEHGSKSKGEDFPIH
jgi:hypothetical protein